MNFGFTKKNIAYTFVYMIILFGLFMMMASIDYGDEGGLLISMIISGVGIISWIWLHYKFRELVYQKGDTSSIFLEWREKSLSKGSMFYEFPIIKLDRDYPLEYYYFSLAEAFQNTGFIIKKDLKENFLLSNKMIFTKDMKSSTSFEVVITGEERREPLKKSDKKKIIKANLMYWGILNINEGEIKHENDSLSPFTFRQEVNTIQVAFSLESNKKIPVERVKNLFNALYYNINGVLNLDPQEPPLPQISSETATTEVFEWDDKGNLKFEGRFPIVKNESLK